MATSSPRSLRGGTCTSATSSTSPSDCGSYHWWEPLAEPERRLAAALTAARLLRDSGLEFVVAPVRSTSTGCGGTSPRSPYVGDFRAEHGETEDTRVAWEGLAQHLDPKRWDVRP